MIDMLIDMYEKNCRLTSSVVKEDPALLRLEIKSDRFRRLNTIAMLSELGESTHYLNWKWWGRGVDHTDREKYVEELIDLLHFVFAGFQSFGMTAEDIHKAYITKNEENWKRFKEKIGWGEPNE